MSGYHTIYSLEHIDYNVNNETGGTLDKNVIDSSFACLYCLQWFWKSVCEYQILYRNYHHSYFDNDVCGASKIEKYSSAYHTVYLHRGFIKILFSKSFFFTSVEVSWEYDLCFNSILSRQKSSSEMMYSEQSKYTRLVQTSLMIKT